MNYGADRVRATPATVGETPCAAHTGAARVIGVRATWIGHSHAAHQTLPLYAVDAARRTELAVPEVTGFVRDGDAKEGVIVLRKQYGIKADVVAQPFGASGAASL